MACNRGIIRGETAPVAWTSRRDSPVVTSRIVRLVHEVVETTELLARGLASLRERGRHCRSRFCEIASPLRGAELNCAARVLTAVDRRVCSRVCSRASRIRPTTFAVSMRG